MAVTGITKTQFANAVTAIKKYVDEHDVQSDWSETDIQNLSCILNKPTSLGGNGTEIRVATADEIRKIFKQKTDTNNGGN